MPIVAKQRSQVPVQDSIRAGLVWNLLVDGWKAKIHILVHDSDLALQIYWGEKRKQRLHSGYARASLLIQQVRYA